MEVDSTRRTDAEGKPYIRIRQAAGECAIRGLLRFASLGNLSSHMSPAVLFFFLLPKKLLFASASTPITQFRPSFI